MMSPDAAVHGIVNFTPVQSYIDPYRGLDPRARIDKLLEDASDSLDNQPARPEAVGDWPRIQIAIRRGGLFIIETTTPTCWAMLRFDPDHHDAGDYEIRRKTHDGIERGRTTKVLAVAADEKDKLLSMLTPFPTRFVVVTVGTARPHARIVWRIGLRDYRKIVDPAG